MTNFLTKLNRRPLVGLYGAGGFGREIMPLNRNFICLKNNGVQIKRYSSCFIDDNSESSTINSIDALTRTQFLELQNSKKYFNVTIGNSVVRESVAKNMIGDEIEPVTLISTRANFHPTTVIGSGGIIGAYASITSNSVIGEFFQANIYSYVAHDCVVGDFVTFAPGAACNGNVTIGDHAYIGTNATIKQGSAADPITIGAHSIIGMGAVITKSVPDYAVVVGNPGKVIRYVDLSE